MMYKISDNYLPYLDGLRGYAIILVLLSHVGLDKIVPGGFGVSLFFFISGFLITKLLIKELSETGTLNFRKFYLRRIVRLYPALIFMVCISIIMMIIIKCPIHFADVFSAIFYLTNYYDLYLKHRLPGDCNIFHILWSLSVEEHFYLFFPIVFYSLYKKKDMLLIVLVFFNILILLFRSYLLFTSHNIERSTIEIYNATHTRADSIIWGCVCALLIFKNWDEKYIKLLKSNTTLITGTGMILFSLLFRNVYFRESVRYTIQAVAFLLIVPAIGFHNHKAIFKVVFENKFIIFIGRLSYSLYLFHWVALTMAGSYFKEFSVNWLAFMGVFTTILALMSYYFIEQPFIKLRRKLGSIVKDNV